ncbi:MAG: class I SAM-dependent methyltransferase [Deltaproteobacteria bacterium]|nr:class I SAM-dependent methyltransferase [Deltaproteobacteria bacterium]
MRVKGAGEPEIGQLHVPETQPAAVEIQVDAAASTPPLFPAREAREDDAAQYEAVHRAVSSVHKDYVPYACHENAKRAVDAVRSALPELDPRALKVVVLTRHEDGMDEPNLPLWGTRDHSQKARFHAVVLYKDRVFDLTASKKHLGIPLQSYLRQMFLPDNRPFAGEQGRSRAYQERVERALARNRFGSPSELLEELRAWTLDAKTYAESAWEGLARMRYAEDETVLPDLGFGPLDLKARCTGSWGSIPAAQTAKRPRVRGAMEIIELPDGSVARIDLHALELGELAQVPNAVNIQRLGAELPRNFNRTDRSLADLRSLYPARLLDPKALRGKVVLDLSAGGGLVVEELREAGVRAFGLELALSQNQKRKLLADTFADPKRVDLGSARDLQLFIRGDIHDPPLLPGQVDAIFETYGVFEYGMLATDDYRQAFYGRTTPTELLTRWKALLKPGGMICISPVDPAHPERLTKALEGIPGLRLEGFFPAADPNSPATCAVLIAD